MALILLVGTPAAYMLATRSFRGRALLVTLSSCRSCCRRRSPASRCWPRSGPSGILGGALEVAGIELVLQTAGVVVALTFVASPFYVRQAQAAFAAVDPTLIDASRTLGAVRGRDVRRGWRSRRAMPGLVAGGALALGRALGEFGATLMFAGSFQGDHPDRAARDLRPLRDRLRRGARALGACWWRCRRGSCSR